MELKLTSDRNKFYLTLIKELKYTLILLQYKTLCFIIQTIISFFGYICTATCYMKVKLRLTSSAVNF